MLIASLKQLLDPWRPEVDLARWEDGGGWSFVLGIRHTQTIVLGRPERLIAPADQRKFGLDLVARQRTPRDLVPARAAWLRGARDAVATVDEVPKLFGLAAHRVYRDDKSR